MPSAEGLVADAERFREMRASEQVVAFLEDRFRSLGATHFLATGIPMPGRPVEPLVLRLHWGEQRGDRSGEPAIAADDSIFRMALRAPSAFAIVSPADETIRASALYRQSAGQGGAELICVPIKAFPPYQACVLAAGRNLSLDPVAMLLIDQFCVEAFRRLFALGALSPDRPGNLSGRERRVVELSAEGRTASEIAAILTISQRTVHAHLQNASEKLRARNKTQTVVEALRYGQITL